MLKIIKILRPDPKRNIFSDNQNLFLLGCVFNYENQKKQRNLHMDMLTKLEELVLIAVLKLGEEAYGIAIYKHIVELTAVALSAPIPAAPRQSGAGCERHFTGSQKMALHPSKKTGPSPTRPGKASAG